MVFFFFVAAALLLPFAFDAAQSKTPRQRRVRFLLLLEEIR